LCVSFGFVCLIRLSFPFLFFYQQLNRRSGAHAYGVHRVRSDFTKNCQVEAVFVEVGDKKNPTKEARVRITDRETVLEGTLKDGSVKGSVATLQGLLISFFLSFSFCVSKFRLFACSLVLSLCSSHHR
jgi:hypothetical protein